MPGGVLVLQANRARGIGGVADAVGELLNHLERALVFLDLQQFVDVLSKSNDQIVQFGGRLASVSSVLANVSTDLGTGLDNLDAAITDVKRFLDERSGALTEGVQRLARWLLMAHDRIAHGHAAESGAEERIARRLLRLSAARAQRFQRRSTR